MGGQGEGERETDVDFMFGQGDVRKFLQQKLRIFERPTVEKAHFISQCVEFLCSCVSPCTQSLVVSLGVSWSVSSEVLPSVCGATQGPSEV